MAAAANPRAPLPLSAERTRTVEVQENHTTSSFFRPMRRIKFSPQSCSSPEP